MAIEIITHRFETEDGIVFRVTKIKAKDRKSLPREYLDGPCVWHSPGAAHEKSLLMANGYRQGGRITTNLPILFVGGAYKKVDFDNRLGFIRKCGNRLKDVKQEIIGVEEKFII
jgi:hypothetical protein